MEVQEMVVVGTQVAKMASLVEKKIDRRRSGEKSEEKYLFSLVLCTEPRALWSYSLKTAHFNQKEQQAHIPKKVYVSSFLG